MGVTDTFIRDTRFKELPRVLTLPWVRPERLLRSWSLVDLTARSGLSYPTCWRADRGEPVTAATSAALQAAFDAAPVSAERREVYAGTRLATLREAVVAGGSAP